MVLVLGARDAQHTPSFRFCHPPVALPNSCRTHNPPTTNSSVPTVDRNDAGNKKKQALDAFADLDRTIGADGYTLTAVIDVLRRLGDWRRALTLLERLAGLGVSASQGLRTSVNAVLSAMGPDNYRRATGLVARAAAEWGVSGDIVTYGTLLLLASARLPPPAPLCTGSAAAAAAAAAAFTVDGSRDESSRGLWRGRSVDGGEDEDRERGGGKWETVNVLWRAVAAKAVPSEACLDMVVFALARVGSWEEAKAFVGAMEEAGLAVSRHQVSFVPAFVRAVGTAF